MVPIWDPAFILQLQEGGETEWTCVASVTDASTGLSRRCDRKIRSSEMNKISKLLADISHQQPDQIDFNLILHLARACLCVDKPDPHQGLQEASVIYQWTGLMGQEAARLRAVAESAKRTTATTADNDYERADADDEMSLAAHGESNERWDSVTHISSSSSSDPSTLPLLKGLSVSSGPLKSMATAMAHRRDQRQPETSISGSSISTTSTTPAAAPKVLLPSSPRQPLSASSMPALLPSPPDSATYLSSSSSPSASPSSSSLGPSALYYRPAILSLGTAGASASTSSTLRLLDAAALPTGTTIIHIDDDDGDDGDENNDDDSTDLATPMPFAPFPQQQRSVGVAQAVPPPLPTSTTTITCSSSVSSGSGDPDIITAATDADPHNPRRGGALRPLPAMRLAAAVSASVASASRAGVHDRNLGAGTGLGIVGGGVLDGRGRRPVATTAVSSISAATAAATATSTSTVAAAVAASSSTTPLPLPMPLPILGELEEYNRLLQETQSRHETLLAQTVQLRRELAALKREQGDVLAAAPLLRLAPSYHPHARAAAARLGEEEEQEEEEQGEEEDGADGRHLVATASTAEVVNNRPPIAPPLLAWLLA